jgi:hypothetical protein
VAHLFEARATAPEDLSDIDYTHDAYFDPEAIHFDAGNAVLVVPFSQEPLPDLAGAPATQVLHERKNVRVERIPFLRHELRIARVEKWGISRKGRDEPGMFYGVEWLADERELRATTSTGPALSVIVGALDVALVITDEIDGWVRRKPRFGGFLDQWEAG